jgi:hypothetical protein
MSRDTLSCSEPITESDILAGIEVLPTEADLPCDDGEPLSRCQTEDLVNLHRPGNVLQVLMAEAC